MGKVLRKVDLEASQDPVWGFLAILPLAPRPWVASSPSRDPQAKLHLPLTPPLRGSHAPSLGDMTPKLLDRMVLERAPSYPQLPEYTPCHPAQPSHQAKLPTFAPKTRASSKFWSTS